MGKERETRKGKEGETRKGKEKGGTGRGGDGGEGEEDGRDLSSCCGQCGAGLCVSMAAVCGGEIVRVRVSGGEGKKRKGGEIKGGGKGGG